MLNKMIFKSKEDYLRYKDLLASFQDPDNLPLTCTKYEFVTALKEINMEYYNRLLQAYFNSNEVQFYWNTVKELDRTNVDFIRIAELVGATEEEILEIFRKIAVDRL